MGGNQPSNSPVHQCRPAGDSGVYRQRGDGGEKIILLSHGDSGVYPWLVHAGQGIWEDSDGEGIRPMEYIGREKEDARKGKRYVCHWKQKGRRRSKLVPYAPIS